MRAPLLLAPACMRGHAGAVPDSPRRSGGWTRIDDASVTSVGSWDAVCDACARGHLQPTVLFYERAARPLV